LPRQRLMPGLFRIGRRICQSQTTLVKRDEAS